MLEKEAKTSGRLFFDESTRSSLENFLIGRLRRSRKTVANGSVSPTIDLNSFRETLKSKTFAEPESLEAVLEWTISSLETGTVQMTHPRYFGLFNPLPTLPSIFADQIAAEFNPQVCVWSHAPTAVEIENHVVKQLAERVGLRNNSGGHFTSGGAEANNTALVCALTTSNSNFSSQGARSFSGQPRVYVSKESHLAWFKIAHQLGLGRDAVRLISTDGLGRMNTQELQRAIVFDRKNGDVPVFVAATAGTTNAGVVDPLIEIDSIAKSNKIWFHVDAAWGGALVASEKFRDVLDGIENADSVTIDAHKWFATTMGAGIFLIREKSILSNTFYVSTDYMPSNDSSVDFYVNSIQWSRRFVGLRLFLSLCSAGWKGYGQHVEHCIAMIDKLAESMVAKGWTLANDSRMAVACLIPPEGSPPVHQIVGRVVDSGSSWVSMTRFEGKEVIRACATNGSLQVSDVEVLVEDLLRFSNT